MATTNTWFSRGRNIGIGAYDDGTGKMTSIDVSSKKIEVEYFKSPTKFTSSDLTKKIDELSGNDMFPNALAYGVVCKVMQKCAEIKGNPQMAQYYKSEYMDYVRRGKRIKNENKISGGYNIIGGEY
tara:strand:- start:814 stop:1191 length:378 start_codon:yes stop_codon:yes gene_type:complete